MTDATQERLYTLEDLEAMPEDGNQYELHEGELFVMPSAKSDHSELVSELLELLRAFVKLHGLGRAYTDGRTYRLNYDPITKRLTAYIPDVSFVRKSRLWLRHDGWFDGAPDLAIEVISPSETNRTIQRKLTGYFKYGTQEVWLVYPIARMIEVYSSVENAREINELETLEGSAVLPGFALKLAELFGLLDEDESPGSTDAPLPRQD